MAVSSLTTSELWNLQKPDVPPRSRLFNLEPIGVGTLFVESLMGYVVRLAECHCLTPRQLILKEIAPRMIQNGYPSTYWTNTINRIFRASSPLIKGNEVNGIMTTTLIQALEELTLQQNLSRLTLLSKSCLMLKFSLLRKHHAWCPICLEEWRREERVIYTPLIWLMEDLGICPQHREQPLLQHCPHCGQKFPPLMENSIAGYCSKCRKWLGSIPPKKKLKQRGLSQEI